MDAPANHSVRRVVNCRALAASCSALRLYRAFPSQCRCRDIHDAMIVDAPIAIGHSIGHSIGH